MKTFDFETMKVKICKCCYGLGYIRCMDGSILDCSECEGKGRIVEEITKEELLLSEIKRPESPQYDLPYDEDE